jgi:hypothetical protein
MALAQIHHDVVKAWLAIPGNNLKKCQGQNRINLNPELKALDRNEVDENFQHLDEAARRLKYKTDKTNPLASR